MISGIMPCSGWIRTGYPFKQAVKSWSSVCDEIIVVVYQREEATNISKILCDIPNVHIHAIQGPPLNSFASYGSYLLFGLFYCKEPDWAISIEADFLISPDNGAALRQALIQAPADKEILLTDVYSLNYAGTHLLYQEEFRRFFPPFDGYVWHRPIGYRPKLGIFPVPFESVDAGNTIANCEGVIALKSGKWGLSFNSKFMNNNPRGFNLLRLAIPIEHLTWTRYPEFVKGKFAHPHWAANNLTIDNVISGDKPMPYTYSDLDEVTGRYSSLASVLKKVCLGTQ